MPRNTKKVKSNDSKNTTKKKSPSPIDKIADIEPMEVSKRNLLVDAALNELANRLERSAQKEEEKKAEQGEDKQKRCPKGQRRNKTTGECEPIGKKPRKLIEGCNYEHKIEGPIETEREVELKMMSIKELRSRLIYMLGIEDPKTESIMGARLKPQFINWIVCLEKKRGLLGDEKEEHKQIEKDDEKDELEEVDEEEELEEVENF